MLFEGAFLLFVLLLELVETLVFAIDFLLVFMLHIIKLKLLIGHLFTQPIHLVLLRVDQLLLGHLEVIRVVQILLDAE